MNPISRSRRNVKTTMEKPAVLEDYQLTFSCGGDGNILRKAGWTVHGVLMECESKKDWELLLEFDCGYDCIQVEVFPYGADEPVKANAFVMAKNEIENANIPSNRLPQERSIRAIAQGMKFHGIDEDVIDYHIMNVPYIPKRRPDQFLRFPEKKRPGRKHKMKMITHDEYLKKSSNKGWFAIGNRVIQLGAHEPRCAFVKWAKKQLVGKLDCTRVVMQTLYDPDIPEFEHDATWLQQTWAENQLVEKFGQADLTAEVVYFFKERRAQQCRISSIMPKRRSLFSKKGMSADIAAALLLLDGTESVDWSKSQMNSSSTQSLTYE